MTFENSGCEQYEGKKRLYCERLVQFNESGSGTMGTTPLMPSENTSPELQEAFDELMTEHGPEGVEYAQESLHQEGGDYYERYFDDKDEVIQDFEMYKRHSGEY